MYVYPGAFVDIGENVHRLPPLAQLRIFCGGVWHNAVLALLCVAAVFTIPCILKIMLPVQCDVIV